MFAKVFLAGLVLILGSAPALAGLINDQLNQGWASYRDQTSSQFSATFARMRAAGYRMIDVDTSPNGSGVLFSQVWEKNSDTRGWAQYRNLTLAQFTSRTNEFRRQGYRLHDFESYRVGSSQLYAAIWIRNTENWSWSSRWDLTAAQYGAYFNEQRDAGRRPVDIEAYQTAGGLRYAAIWYQNPGNAPWVQLRDMSRASYQAEVDRRHRAGYRVIDFESYLVGTSQRYAAIWERNPAGRGLAVRSDLTELGFANVWRQYSDLGLRVVDLERYAVSGGVRYAGVWVENEPARYDYPRQDALSAMIAKYRADNSLPGISVAVIRNGAVIYRRGFGHADVNDGKWASGATVYNAASVSKVIGGTLAAKLEAEDKLADGTAFSLDLNLPTSNYLSNIPIGGGQTATIPAHHTHTVEQLFSHLSCVAHYTTSPSIANQTTHRASAVTAVQNIWNTGLVTTRANGGSGCTVGSTVSYSTPALTFAAAVLERVTGRTINRLVQEELFARYGLSTMRVQFDTASLPANYDRATPYDNDGNETNYSNSSWKVLGGGIETDVVDLAGFGWKVLSGQIVTPSVRDNRLFAAVSAGCGTSTAGACSFGLSWQRSSANSRRVFQHDGSWTGARSFVRLYPKKGDFTPNDDSLVIAIMSNSRRGDHNPATLATQIATEIWATVVEE